MKDKQKIKYKNCSKAFDFRSVAFILIFGFCTHAAGAWKEFKGTHFLAYCPDNPSTAKKMEKFTKDILHKAEIYYKNIATDIGYPRHSEFWLWDNRVKIYIYPDHESYVKMTKQPKWSRGVADFETRTISSYSMSDGFADSILPHELAHFIFRDFVGWTDKIPTWLDEGVAQWAEVTKRDLIKGHVKHLYNQKALMSLSEVMRIDITLFKEDKVRLMPALGHEKKGHKKGLILDGEELIYVYYMQSVSMVGFLIEEYGSKRFVGFCRQLRDGKTVLEALTFTYPTHIHNLKEFEEKWILYLEKLKVKEGSQNEKPILLQSHMPENDPAL